MKIEYQKNPQDEILKIQDLEQGTIYKVVGSQRDEFVLILKNHPISAFCSIHFCNNDIAVVRQPDYWSNSKFLKYSGVIVIKNDNY